MKIGSPRRVHIGALVVIGALALAGCGGDDDSSSTSAGSSSSAAPAATTPTTVSSGGSSGGSPDTSAPSSNDLCRLLTKSEAEAVLGTAVGDALGSAAEGPLGQFGSCRYRAVDDTAPEVRSTVNVFVLGTRLTRAQFDQELGGDAPDAEVIPGVGERALLLGEGALLVFDDGAAISVQALRDREPKDRAVLIDLARKALERL